MTSRDAYSILGLPPGATIDEIRDAFRRIARETHPDVAVRPDPVRFIEALAAYRLLIETATEADLKDTADPEFDGSWEWSFREKQIRAGFERVRASWATRKLTEPLLERIAARIAEYGSKQELNKLVEDDVRRIIADRVWDAERTLSTDLSGVVTGFNQTLDTLFLAFHQRVREQRRRRIFDDALFWKILVPALGVCGAGSIHFLGPSMDAVALASATATFTGWLLASQVVARAPTKDIMRLDVPGLPQVSQQLQYQGLSKMEGVGLGGFVAALDVLADGDLDGFGIIALVAAGLSAVFAPSLEKIKEKVLRNVEAKVRAHLCLETRLESFLNTIERQVLEKAYESYMANRRKALSFAVRLPSFGKRAT